MMRHSTSPRYEALDGVRAAAMLLGVFYHALLFSTSPAVPMRARLITEAEPIPTSGALLAMDWLHCFRMPLFFLVSGFFCHMMFMKYGLRGYLVRRWVRIGIPLVIGLLTIVPIYVLEKQDAPPQPRGFQATFHSPPALPVDPHSAPPPPPGVVPPPMTAFDQNQDGSIDADEYKAFQESLSEDTSQTPDEEHDVTNATGESDHAYPIKETEGIAAITPVQDTPAIVERSFSPPGYVSTWLFGAAVPYFKLYHLWFLWYLLVFATVTPFLSRGYQSLAGHWWTARRDSASTGSGGLDWLPICIGVASIPALLPLQSAQGWTLGLAMGIGRAFPDFLWSFEPDMPFYLIYFLGGWWLYHRRDRLTELAANWSYHLLLGLVFYAGASMLSRHFAQQTALPYYTGLRIVGYSLYAFGAVYTAWGFLGLFQQYADRPTVIGRYLAETSLWVYLLHQVLLIPILFWLAPMTLPWWNRGLAATGLTMAASLLLFESCVRPTPLMLVFGPGASSRRPGPTGSLASQEHPDPLMTAAMPPGGRDVAIH